MADLQLTVTAAERDYLADLLKRVLKDTSIEEHRTRTPTYREHILQQENLIRQLLEKLRQPQA
jgi:hypothetical protein